MVLFQQAGKISAAYQAVIFFGNCIFKEVTGSFSNQPLQLPVKGVGAVFNGFEGFCIMEKSKLFISEPVSLCKMVSDYFFLFFTCCFRVIFEI